MAWNTKRDGYYSAPKPAPLGKPVERLAANASTTHVITIPGTTYRLFLNADVIDAAKLLKHLAKTTVKGIGSKRVKASPELHTIAEYSALTEGQAA